MLHDVLVVCVRGSGEGNVGGRFAQVLIGDDEVFAGVGHRSVSGADFLQLRTQLFRDGLVEQSSRGIVALLSSQLVEHNVRRGVRVKRAFLTAHAGDPLYDITVLQATEPVLELLHYRNSFNRAGNLFGHSLVGLPVFDRARVLCPCFSELVCFYLRPQFLVPALLFFRELAFAVGLHQPLVLALGFRCRKAGGRVFSGQALAVLRARFHDTSVVEVGLDLLDEDRRRTGTVSGQHVLHSGMGDDVFSRFSRHSVPISSAPVDLQGPVRVTKPWLLEEDLAVVIPVGVVRLVLGPAGVAVARDRVDDDFAGVSSGHRDAAVVGRPDLDELWVEPFFFGQPVGGFENPVRAVDLYLVPLVVRPEAILVCSAPQHLGLDADLVLGHDGEKLVLRDRFLTFKVRNDAGPLDLLGLDTLTLQPANDLLCGHLLRQGLPLAVRPVADRVLHLAVELRSPVVVLGVLLGEGLLSLLRGDLFALDGVAHPCVLSVEPVGERNDLAVSVVGDQVSGLQSRRIPEDVCLAGVAGLVAFDSVRVVQGVEPVRLEDVGDRFAFRGVVVVLRIAVLDPREEVHFKGIRKLLRVAEELLGDKGRGPVVVVVLDAAVPALDRRKRVRVLDAGRQIKKVVRQSLRAVVPLARQLVANEVRRLREGSEMEAELATVERVEVDRRVLEERHVVPSRLGRLGYHLLQLRDVVVLDRFQILLILGVECPAVELGLSQLGHRLAEAIDELLRITFTHVVYERLRQPVRIFGQSLKVPVEEVQRAVLEQLLPGGRAGLLNLIDTPAGEMVVLKEISREFYDSLLSSFVCSPDSLRFDARIWLSSCVEIGSRPVLFL